MPAVFWVLTLEKPVRTGGVVSGVVSVSACWATLGLKVPSSMWFDALSGSAKMHLLNVTLSQLFHVLATSSCDQAKVQWSNTALEIGVVELENATQSRLVPAEPAHESPGRMRMCCTRMLFAVKFKPAPCNAMPGEGAV